MDIEGDGFFRLERARQMAGGSPSCCEWTDHNGEFTSLIPVGVPPDRITIATATPQRVCSLPQLQARGHSRYAWRFVRGLVGTVFSAG